MLFSVKFSLSLLLTVMFVTFSQVAAAVEKSPLEKVNLRLVWKHQFQFAGYYVAIQKGFYAKRGLSVDIHEFDPTFNTIKSVINGETEFAVGRSSLLIDKAEGKDIVALLAAFQHSPFMIMTRAFTGIEKPADLRGRRIMLTPDAANSGELISMLLKAGLTQQDYTRQPHSFNVNDLINNNTDAMSSYVSNEPYKMIQQGISYNILHPADYGFDMYSDILYTSSMLANEKPALVENFYEASIEGWKYAFANIAETVSIIHQFYNSQNRSREALIYEAHELKKLAFDERKNFGTLLPHRFRSIAQIYILAGIINKSPAMEGFIYKPPAGKLNLTYDEIAYIKDKQVLNICVQKNWLPYENIQRNHYRGILADFSNLIRDKTGLSVYPIPTVSHQQALALTLQGVCDITSAAIIQTADRNSLLFSDSYINIPLVYASKKPIKDITQLKGSVAIATSAPCYYKIMNNGQFNFVETKSTLGALEMLLDGQVDGVIGAQAHIKYLLVENKINSLNLTDYSLFLDISYAMNQQHQILLNILNKTLEIITPRDYDKIMSRWITATPQQSSNVQLYIALISIISLFSLFILYRYINTLLRSKILKELSETDQLTGIANRRKSLQDIQKHINLSNRYGHMLSLIFFDIDDFKNINDQHGHKTGDRILIELTDLITKQIRKTDLFGRWGGEEFILSSPESSINDAEKMATHLETKISQHDFKLAGKVSCSFGITVYKNSESLDDFINRADKTMYSAKLKGKNCIMINDPQKQA